MKLSDKEIVNRLGSGNDQLVNQAFHFLYRAYYRVVEKMILSKGGSEEDAADVFQNALLVFLDMVETGKYKQLSSVKTMLYAISRNLFLKELRNQKRSGLAHDEWATRQEFEVEGVRLDTGVLALKDLLSQLDPGCESLLVDFYFKGLSFDQIAEQTGLTNRNSAKVKKSRCLSRLIKLVRKYNLEVGSFILK